MYGIYTYIWLICMVNVAKYTIHGYYGFDFKFQTCRKQQFHKNLNSFGLGLPTPLSALSGNNCGRHVEGNLNRWRFSSFTHDPWGWYIYLHELLIFRVNSGLPPPLKTMVTQFRRLKSLGKQWWLY